MSITRPPTSSVLASAVKHIIIAAVIATIFKLIFFIFLII